MLRLLRQEKGSVMVLVALAMVVLIAFSALAVDVGYLYYRKAQMMSYADAASLAGGVALRDAPATKDPDEVKAVVLDAVKDVLQSNGFSQAELDELDCDIVSDWDDIDPAVAGMVYVSPATAEVQVNLARPEGWFLARVLNLVRSDPLEDPVVPSQARAEVYGRDYLIELNAGIVSFREEGKNNDGVWLRGSSSLSTGEEDWVGVYSNYDLTVQGSAECDNGESFGFYSRNLYERGIDAEDYFYERPEILEEPLPSLYDKLDWDAVEAEARASGNVYENLNPKLTVNGTVDWSDGAYFDGHVDIQSKAHVTWGGVIFVDGDLSIAGGATLIGNPFIVVTGDVKIAGTSSTGDANVTATVYALGDIEITGTSDTFTGALWSEQNVILSGNSSSFIYREPDGYITGFIKASIAIVR